MAERSSEGWRLPGCCSYMLFDDGFDILIIVMLLAFTRLAHSPDLDVQVHVEFLPM